MVGPFYFALKSRLAGIAGRNKLLINMKAHLQRCAFFVFIWFRVQGSRFRVQGRGGGFAAFLLGDARKWYFNHGFTGYPYDKKVRKMQEGPLRKMSDRALLGRFLSSYLCYTKEKQFGRKKS